MRIAVPNKGRLHEPSEELLERAGLHLVDGADRQLHADTVDPDVTVLYARAADIPEYVADGAADVGITGLDQVRESDTDDLVELRGGGGGGATSRPSMTLRTAASPRSSLKSPAGTSTGSTWMST